MHLTVAAVSILAVLLTGVWRKAPELHTSLLYVIVGNLLYNVLTYEWVLWEFHPEVFPEAVTELMYTFIVFPCTVLLYLARFPEGTIGRKLLHIVFWIAVYALVEFVWERFGRIDYHHGWSYWWSISFDFIMFPMLRLHQKRSWIAYVLSFFITLTFLFLFKVPVHMLKTSM
ncbi:CBO0543 family protein [Paenibacillus hamazuiensis]|uniref:CBO0543 family protein n=1 Tax=Paenibacillus hamazuiensis TaxID=2936508 RepID=UPI00200CB828|nr:CBO0543 family protein [Paenibacillus hamazuiensis]